MRCYLCPYTCHHTLSFMPGFRLIIPGPVQKLHLRLSQFVFSRALQNPYTRVARAHTALCRCLGACTEAHQHRRAQLFTLEWRMLDEGDSISCISTASFMILLHERCGREAHVRTCLRARSISAVGLIFSRLLPPQPSASYALMSISSCLAGDTHKMISKVMSHAAK